MVQTDSTYWYGVTAAVYIATCWIFSVVFVSTEAAYLDSHLKLEQVVERCNFSRRYVSKVFTERFGGFSDYVNGLRLNYFERYKLNTLALQTKVLQRPVVLPHTKRILKQKNDYHKSKI